MSEARSYTGGCHCGRVRYEAKAALDQAIACNCSICSKKGYLLAFIDADQFRLLSGEDELQDYQFNTHTIHHVFCKTCGIQSFARGAKPDGSQAIALNVRCLDDVDLGAVPVMNVDGKSR